jgi:hypothetical protein
VTSQRRCLVSCGRVSHRNAIPFDVGADFKPGTQARTRIEQFAFNYSTLLNSLHLAFNGEPERLDAAIGVMYDLRVQPLLGGIGQAQKDVPGFAPGCNFYLLVDDIDATIDKAVHAGGQRFVESTPVDGYCFAMIRDPEGNAIGLIKPFTD